MPEPTTLAVVAPLVAALLAPLVTEIGKFLAVKLARVLRPARREGAAPARPARRVRPPRKRE